MTHASLFSGIGGFDLAAAWAGWTNLFNCEINPFCRKVLTYHFPDSTSYEDITDTDFTLWRGRVDVLTGGFPCQPFSVAGKRQGAADDRYLWPQMLRAIREAAPRWVVGENVYGLASQSRGLVFESVCADLEDAGYEVLPFVIPACAVGAPHRRDRLWIIAHRADAGIEDMPQGADQADADRVAADAHGDRFGQREDQQELLAQCSGAADAGSCRQAHDVADTARVLLQGFEQRPRTQQSWRGAGREIVGFDRFPTQSPLCGGDDGIPYRLDADAVLATVRGRDHFAVWRRESIKAYGNAIVPQVAYRLFSVIDEIEQNCKRRNTNML